MTAAPPDLPHTEGALPGVCGYCGRWYPMFAADAEICTERTRDAAGIDRTQEEDVNESAIDQRYTDAAAGRYKSLRTHIFVELSEHCTVDHKGRAADAVAALVRPELESTYAVLLESNDLRDAAIARAADLERQLAEAREELAEVRATGWIGK